MTNEQFEQLQKIVTEQIKITVNGKIDKIDIKVDKMTNKIDEYIVRDETHRADYKEETEIWREKIEQKLELNDNIKGFGKVFMYIVGVIIAVGTVYKIFK